MGRNRFLQWQHVILIAAWCINFNSTFSSYGFSQQEMNEGDNPNARLQWFYRQRSYPNDTMKQGYLLEAYAKAQEIKQRKDLRPVSTLKWIPVGLPSTGPNDGRVPAIALDPTDTNIVYIGAADGGVWKSTNSGAVWIPLTDYQPSLASGSLLVDPKNPLVIYYGTGEPYNSIDSYGGTGILKSTDGGLSWLSPVLTNEKRITKIAIQPGNSNLLLASTWGGVYRSTDAGGTWTRNSTIIGKGWDIEFDPVDSNIVYASANNEWKSIDAGISWNKIDNGLPPSFTYRRVMAISHSNPSVLYLFFQTGFLYKSVNAGASWSQVTVPQSVTGNQGWYDLAVAVSPIDSNRIMIGGVFTYYSSDGGASWTQIVNGIHPDCHSIVFDKGGAIVYLGHDGGVSRSNDSGSTFITINNNLAITQFYSHGLDQLQPTTIWGGSQDNGLLKSTDMGIAWSTKLGGDIGMVSVDYNNSDTVYAVMAMGKHYRTFNGSRFFPIDTGITGNSMFITPLAMAPDSSNILYTATNAIFKTTNRGSSWNATASSYPWGVLLVSEIAIPFIASQTIYAAVDASLYRSTDGGATWSISYSGVPGRIITSVVPHPTTANTIYFTTSGTGANHIFKSIDSGATWNSINGNFPLNLPVSSIAIDSSNDQNLYIGTDLGIWNTAGSESIWMKDDGFPNVAVLKLGISSDNYLVAATHGRGMFKARFGSNASSFITVTKPNGGENWFAGSIQTISWFQSGVFYVKIELSTDSAATWTTIAASVPASPGNYSWTVPHISTSKALIRVSDATNTVINGINKNIFTIVFPSITVTSPNGGESWKGWSDHSIIWTEQGITTVQLEYTSDHGVSWNLITGAVAASQGSYLWTVPNTPSTQALVRVSDTSFSAINDTSNSVFSIIGSPPIIYTKGWNLVSIPVKEQGLASQFYPLASSKSSLFNPSLGYTIVDSIYSGLGYWVKFPVIVTDTIPGAESLSDTVSISAGWNLIGALGVPIPLTDLTTDPPGMISGGAFEYKHGYAPTDTLKPYQGYWVKSSGNGTLILQKQ
ncbi:MAG: hypothetical protein ACHQQQ_10285 [Bacteroidota bacterium]